MIGSGGTGASFSGLQRYLLHSRSEEGEKRVGWTSVRNLAHDDPGLAATQMEATASQNTRVEKPVYHLSLNAPPGESLSREQWERVADRVLADLGLKEHQALLVSHTDRPHEHVHLMINRVHPEHLKAWSNSHDFARIERSLRGIERELGLREVPGHHHQLAGQEAPARDRGLTSGEVQEQQRTGEESWASRVRFAVYNDLRDAEGWGELSARLGEHGLQLAKRGPGLVVTDGEHQVKVSRIHRGRSSGKLAERYGMSFDDWQGRVRELKGAVGRYEKLEELRQKLEAERVRRAHEMGKDGNPMKVLSGLAREQRSLRDRLGRQLRVIYGPNDVEKRLSRLEGLARRHGYDRAAANLTDKPTQLGKLAGELSLGGAPDPARKEALRTVPRAAETLKKLGAVHHRMAKYLDDQVKELWHSEGRPLEGPDSATQARWRMEDAAEKIDRLLPQVYRDEEVEGLSVRLKRCRDPEELSEWLRQYPQDFGRLRGKGWGPFENEARKRAREVAPRLAAAVLEHGQAQLLSIRIFLDAKNRRLGRSTQRFEKARDAVHQLPSTTKLLLQVARAAQRVGIRAVGQVLPIPAEIGHLRGTVADLKSLGRRVDSIASAALGSGPDRSATHPPWAKSTGAARVAAEVGTRILVHVLPLPQQAAVVQLALRTAASLTRTVTREISL